MDFASLHRDVKEKRKRRTNKDANRVRKEEDNNEQKEDTVLVEEEAGSFWNRE